MAKDLASVLAPVALDRLVPASVRNGSPELQFRLLFGRLAVTILCTRLNSLVSEIRPSR
jgi:hypothetical protein